MEITRRLNVESLLREKLFQKFGILFPKYRYSYSLVDSSLSGGIHLPYSTQDKSARSAPLSTLCGCGMTTSALNWAKSPCALSSWLRWKTDWFMIYTPRMAVSLCRTMAERQREVCIQRWILSWLLHSRASPTENKCRKSQLTRLLRMIRIQS